RAAVDDAPDARTGGGLDDPADRRGVDRTIVLFRHAGPPVLRRDVIDDLHVRHGRLDRAGVADVANRKLDPGSEKVACAGSIPCQRPHDVAAGRQAARQMAAGESRCAGYEITHRSATSVTGEPKIFSRPARSRSPSIATVRRRERMSLWNAIGRTNCLCTDRTRNPDRSSAST